MSPDTRPGQHVPEELPHYERGRHAGQHHEGDPFRDSELQGGEERLHEAFEHVHGPGATEDHSEEDSEEQPTEESTGESMEGDDDGG